jgi:multicomponent Na+:H+ antiporter subunit E
LFWIFITASFSLANIIIGLICSCITAVIVWLVFHIRLPEDITLPFLVRLPVFAVVLAWGVIKANFILAILVIGPRHQIAPIIVKFKTELRGDFIKTILAGSITLTPGTLTIDTRDYDLFVHCLAVSHRKGLFERRGERLVAWLFKQNLRESNSH